MHAACRALKRRIDQSSHVTLLREQSDETDVVTSQCEVIKELVKVMSSTSPSASELTDALDEVASAGIDWSETLSVIAWHSQSEKMIMFGNFEGCWRLYVIGAICVQRAQHWGADQSKLEAISIAMVGDLVFRSLQKIKGAANLKRADPHLQLIIEITESLSCRLRSS